MSKLVRPSREETRKLVSEIQLFVEKQIAIQAWTPGTRLPTERELAKRFHTARNTVRRALADLEAAGKIRRHVGRGTFVEDQVEPAVGFGPTDTRSINPEEIMEVRLLIEPAMAELIVARASRIELDGLQELVDRGGASQDMAEFEVWDSKLHSALVAASKNDYLGQIMTDIHAIRQRAEWGQLNRRGMTEERRAAYQVEHQAIVTALADRDADAARAAIQKHLRHVRHNLLGF